MKMLETPEQRKIKEVEEEEIEKALSKMSIEDIETLCAREDIKPIKAPKKDSRLANRYVEYLKGKISIKAIFDYAHEQKIDIIDIEDDYEKRTAAIRENFEEDYSPESIDRDFEDFLRTISMKFSPVKCNNDEGLQLQLAQFIKTYFPSKSVTINSETTEGTISILIDSEYGLLPLIASDREELRKMVGTIEDYTKVCTESSVVAFDTGKLPSIEIEEYAREVVGLGAYFTVINQYVMRKKTGVEK
ncbi:MAG: hypothetical protein BJBARM5_0531 [Candidatus Parvarchaeum acidophilus ARMAN-5]|jgi:hypothetical protein|uniref:Uncharacterized protein n=1 Tax=Candidatus Parvarchaeum acidophilus ARMAN-5 TaxID=662762 RepID=D6GVL8_PARA5|nr:MAG: hypothetical protein BJBARM5_0531 [Candidatus Parvarchaeum acidophilus ARMAN-5]